MEKKLRGGASTKKNDQQRNRQLKTRAPLFLEQTPNGELARGTKELLQRLEPILGYRIRVVEHTGTSLKSLLNQTSIGKGIMCGRELCITCNQGGEDIPACTRSSVVYENICTQCNPSAMAKGKLRETRIHVQSDLLP